MSSTLILIPTSLELHALKPRLGTAVQQADGVIELCGFGVIAAAARTTQLISLHRPDRVLLVGIAGAIGDRLTVGAAYCFDEVACYGIGVGSAEEHLSAGELGWSQQDASVSGATLGSSNLDAIQLHNRSLGPSTTRRQLLTVCSASASEEDVRLRRQKLPEASAEDMEGFAVALACTLAGLQLQIIRGISNAAGDRDKSNWKIQEALQAAGDLLRIPLQGVANP